MRVHTRVHALKILKYNRNRFKRDSWLEESKSDRPQYATRRRHLLEAPDFDPERDKAREVFGRTYVGAEDKALCEGVQRGMRQQGFNQGLYMIDPDQENFTEEGVRFFHSRYTAALEATIAAATR